MITQFRDSICCGQSPHKLVCQVYTYFVCWSRFFRVHIFLDLFDQQLVNFFYCSVWFCQNSAGLLCRTVRRLSSLFFAWNRYSLVFSYIYFSGTFWELQTYNGFTFGVLFPLISIDEVIHFNQWGFGDLGIGVYWYHQMQFSILL